jgi:hypothetical protein
MKSITIVSDDRVGLLADISYILAKSGINIDGISADVVGGKAVISLEVKDQKKASHVLTQSGYMTADLEAIIIKASSDVKDRIADMLEDEMIKVHGFSVLTADNSEGVYAINVDKPRKASRLLNTFILGNEINPYGD